MQVIVQGVFSGAVVLTVAPRAAPRDQRVGLRYEGEAVNVVEPSLK